MIGSHSIETAIANAGPPPNTGVLDHAVRVIHSVCCLAGLITSLPALFLRDFCAFNCQFRRNFRFNALFGLVDSKLCVAYGFFAFGNIRFLLRNFSLEFFARRLQERCRQRFR